MNIGNWISLGSLLLSVVAFAVAYGALKNRVEQNTKDIDSMKTNYGNIYSMLSDIRVQLASLTTKVDERFNNTCTNSKE